MAYKKDWIKSTYETLYTQCLITIAYLDGHLGAFGINGTSAAWINNVFKPIWQAYANAFLAWQNPSTRTPGIIATLQDARAAFVPLYRELYIMLKALPTVTDNDLIAMDLPKRSNAKPTPAPDPTTVPEATVQTPSPAVVEIHFRDRDSKSKGKPAGVHGAEIAWAILETMPEDWSALTNSSFDTHTPLTLTFSGTERGKHLYFSLRWENTRGVKGNWSEIYETVIP
jgi:hypothetical protein